MERTRKGVSNTEVVLTEECIEHLADVVAKKVRNMTKPTREAQETAEDAIERRMRDLCE